MTGRTKHPSRSEGSVETGGRGQPSMGFLDHLDELRRRLLRSLACLLLVFLGLSWFARDLFALFAGPMIERMPGQATMLAIDVTAPFLVPLKLCLLLAVFLCMPYLLHQLWAFVAPGLYRGERRLALPLLFSSLLLFYLGSAFAYWVVLPLLFLFIASMTPEGVQMMTDINRYFGFSIKMFLAFGIAFETPVLIVLLVRTGAVEVEQLAAKRAYVFVGCFIVGMLLTPPDVISQCLLAIPVWLLYELGLCISRRMRKPPRTSDDDLGLESGPP